MRQRPLEVVVLGAEGVGKTSFLAGLAVLGEADRPGGVVVRGDDPPSQSFLHDLGSSLRRGRFPPSTTATRSIHATIVHRGRRLRVSLVDFAGEGFRAAATSGELARMPLLLDRLHRADVIVLMLDPLVDLGFDETAAPSTREPAAAAGTPSDAARQQHGTRRDAVQARYSALLLALINAIEQVMADGRPSTSPAVNGGATGSAAGDGRGADAGARGTRSSRSSSPEVAIVLTKADRVPGALGNGGAEAILARRLPAFMERIRRWARMPAVFAISAVGGVDEVVDGAGRVHAVPAAALRPSGYDALLDWLIARKRARDQAPMRRRLLASAGVAAMLLAIAVTALLLLRWDRERALRDPATSVDAITRIPVEGLAGPSRAVLDERVDLELDELERRLGTGPALLALRDSIVPELQRLEPVATGTRRERRQRLLEQARGALHDAWAADLLAQRPDPSPAALRALVTEVAAFRQAFPSSDRLTALEGHQATAARLVDATLRRRVADVRWDASRPERTAEFLLNKAAAVEAYANDPLALLDAAQRAERRAAAEAARVLAETRDWSLTIDAIGPFTEGRHVYVDVVRLEPVDGTSSRSSSTSAGGHEAGAKGASILWRWESRQQATRHRPALRDGAERILQLRSGDRVGVAVGIGTRGPWFDGWWGGTGFARIPSVAPEAQPLSLRFLSGTFRLASFPHDRAWTSALGDASIELTLKPLGGAPFTPQTWDLLQRHIMGDGS